MGAILSSRGQRYTTGIDEQRVIQVLTPYGELTVLIVAVAAIALVVVIYEIVHYGRRKKLD